MFSFLRFLENSYRKNAFKLNCDLDLYPVSMCNTFSLESKWSKVFNTLYE